MGFLYTVLIVGLTGLILGIILSLASKFFAVETDERTKKIRECLPGANCGACGYSGCDGYAVALSRDECAPNLCTAGGDDTAKALSEILGKEIKVIQKRAVIHCRHGNENAKNIFAYSGAATCVSASLLYGGPLSCKYGCLGFGDCVKVCEYGALSLKDGNIEVDKYKCIACGKCANICPKGIISIEPRDYTHFIGCSNKDKGATARKACSAACIGCSKCAKVCPSGAIEIVDNLAVMNYEKCTSCGECERNCPTKAINTY